MINELNKKGLFNGQIVIVQPIEEGLADKINEQDGIYTLILRGLANGESVDQKEIVTSVSRAINPYTDWESYIKCAENPQMEIIISNTAESGIAFGKSDRPESTPPVSFPGKLTAFLHHRFNHFAGGGASSDREESGLIILPANSLTAMATC